MNNFQRYARLTLASPFIGLVHLYRVTLSPDHGPLRHLFPYGYCRHELTCSSYALQILHQRWLPIALVLIIKRVLSCNPWTKVTEEKMKTVISRM